MITSVSVASEESIIDCISATGASLSVLLTVIEIVAAIVLVSTSVTPSLPTPLSLTLNVKESAPE